MGGERHSPFGKRRRERAQVRQVLIHLLDGPAHADTVFCVSEVKYGRAASVRRRFSCVLGSATRRLVASSVSSMTYGVRDLAERVGSPLHHRVQAPWLVSRTWLRLWPTVRHSWLVFSNESITVETFCSMRPTMLSGSIADSPHRVAVFERICCCGPAGTRPPNRPRAS